LKGLERSVEALVDEGNWSRDEHETRLGRRGEDVVDEGGFYVAQSTKVRRCEIVVFDCDFLN